MGCWLCEQLEHVFFHSKLLAHFKVHGRNTKKRDKKPDKRDKSQKNKNKNKKQLFGTQRKDGDKDESDTSDHDDNAGSDSMDDDEDEVTFTTKFLSDLGTDVDYRLRVDMPVAYTISTLKGLEPQVCTAPHHLTNSFLVHGC